MPVRLHPLIAGAFCYVSIGAIAAQACAFHNYVPQITIVDRLLESSQIVAARPSQEDPFRYAPMSTGTFPAADLETLRPMTQATLTQFQSDPEAYALFTRAPYKPWTRIADVDGALLPIVEDILGRLPYWRSGGEEDRVRYFADLIGHSDIRVHRLALRELDRVDYVVLRSLKLADRAGTVAERMEVLTDPSLQPIQILLLGLSDDPDVASELQKGLLAFAGSDDPRLGAYAIALFEHGGPDAVATLAEAMLADPSLPASGREAVVAALAVHNQTGTPRMAAAINGSIADATREDPSVAALVARQFGSHQDWSQAKTLAAVLQAGGPRSVQDLFAVGQYVAIARESRLEKRF